MNDESVDQEIRELVIESHRRCTQVRVRLVLGELSDAEAITQYAVATAPLAKAARLAAS